MRELSVEQIQENFDTFTNLCDKLGKRKDAAISFVNHFSERLAVCPASVKTEYEGCYPGGLIEQNLLVLKNALFLNKHFGMGIKKTSILFCCLFRNMGLLGTRDKELLQEQENEWRRNTLGELYKYNKDLDFMLPVDRTTYLIQQFGFDLSEDEFLALRLSNTRMNEEYSMNEPKLAFLLYTASRMAQFGLKAE